MALDGAQRDNKEITMPVWIPRTWRLQQSVLDEQNRQQELRRWSEPPEPEEEPMGEITPEEIRGRAPEVRPREPIGWPWEWLGVTAWEYQKYVEQQKRPGELTLEELRAMPPPSFPQRPWGERIRQYQELPFTEQMGYELPFWYATLFAPTATALRTGLLGKAGKPAQIVAAALKPVAAVEQAPAKAISKVADPVLRKLATLIKGEKLARGATRRARKVEWGKRFKKARQVYESIEDPELAMRASLAQLRGKAPIKPGALGEALSPEEFSSLLLKVKRHPTLPYTDKIHAQKALNTLLGTDEVLRPFEIRILERIFPGITEINRLKFMMGPQLWRNFVDAANLPRAFLASCDLSVSFRQCAPFLTRFPREFKGLMRVQLKTLFSQKNWQALDDIVRADPDFGLIDQIMRVYQAPEPGARVALAAREEMFMSSIAEKIPWVKISERAFTAGGNYARYRAAKLYLDIARKAGLTDENTLRGLGKLINAATGRGDLPRVLRGSGPVINAFFFAPRFVISRLQLPTLMFHSSPLVRREAARMFVQFMGAGTTILSLAALAGASIELDPRSSDFGKIKIGNTRLDIWAGYVQWARFLGQLVAGEAKVVRTGKIREQNRLDTLWRLVQSKEAPLASIVTDLLAGETFLGEPMFTGGWQTVKRELRNRFMPLFGQDLWDAIETDGLLGGAAALPGLMGVGIISYEPGEAKWKWGLSAK